MHWTQSPCPVLSLTCLLIGPNRADTKFQEEDDDVDEPGIVLYSLIVHKGDHHTRIPNRGKCAYYFLSLIPILVTPQQFPHPLMCNNILTFSEMQMNRSTDRTKIFQGVLQ